jgi:hypothetical protein
MAGTLPRARKRHNPGRLRPVATDYDAPRKTDDELAAESLETLQATQTANASAIPDIDEPSDAEPHDLPGADLSNERLEVVVIPKQRDEFTCTRCFLVMHVSQQATDTMDNPICLDCS